MPWARLEDTYWCNPKIADAGNEAAGIYSRALSYCAMHTTDGYVPKAIAASLATAAALQVLEQHGLWQRVDGGETFATTHRRDSGNRPLDDAETTIPARGYWIADFLRYHLTKRETAELREKKQAAGRARATAPAEAPAKAPAAPPARSTRAAVPTPTPIDDDYVVVGDDELARATNRLGWSSGQIATASKHEPAKVLAIIAKVEATPDVANPAALAYQMLIDGQDPRNDRPKAGTGSTRAPVDAFGRCRKWIEGGAWDETLSEELAIEEWAGIYRRAEQTATAAEGAELLSLWRVEHERRVLAATIAVVAS